MTNQKPLVAILAAASLVAGCATSPTPNTRGLGGGDYNRAQARGVAQVEIGIVEAVRAVRLDAAEGGASRAIIPAVGALGGGALGSQIGKGDGKKVGAVIGALAGFVGGQAVQKARDNITGLEITVRVGSRLVSVTQADEGVPIRMGDPVQIIHGRGAARVAPL
jgi:outer membrane lipoprotein SlyB